jgi:CheY-like chemotaxis protein
MSLILIVDDDADTGRLLARLLRGHGYDTAVVQSGREAIDFVIGAGKPALMLLDIMMPKMSGLDTLALLRALPAATDLPVVMLTALEGEENVERARQLGALDYLLKRAFEPRRLIELIARHVPPDPPAARSPSS